MLTKTRLCLSLLFSLLLMQLLPSTGQATTAIIPSDDQMIIGARAIVQGRVVSNESAYDRDRGMVFTYTTIEIEDALKGPFAEGQQIVIKEMGGIDGNIGTRIYGSPSYKTNSRVLLYLTSWPDGSLRTYQMFLGKYTITTSDGESVVERATEGGEVDILPQATSAPSTAKSTLRAFKRMVRSRLQENAAQSEQHEKQYYDGQPLHSEPPDYGSRRSRGDIRPSYTFIFNPPIRWFESTVEYQILEDGAPDGGTDDVAAAMAAWSSVPGVGISIVSSGTTTNCGNSPGGGNVVSFNNCGGWFAREGCANILALAGLLRFDTSQQTNVNGTVFIKALQGFLAVNPSAECYFSNHANIQEVITHEFGHTLGLGHSQYSEATMFAYAHFDGRAASLKQDDIDGVLYMYPAGGGTDPGPPKISTTSLPDGQVGVAYTQTLRASGGIPPYTWNKVGLLPAGLTINAGGVIGGTPTTSGTTTFTATLQDSRGGRDQKEFSLRITEGGGGGGPLQITTTSLPNGQRNSAYNQSLQATGGQLPYTWTLQSGQLPAGMSLSNSGQMTGSPTETGTFNLRVRVADSSSATQNKDLSLTIAAAGGSPLRITTASVPPATVGESYGYTMQAAGGTTPYSWSVANGALPPGLFLNRTGLFSGTPSRSGSFLFTVRVTDSASATADVPINLTVAEPGGGGGGGPLHITTDNLEPGIVDDPYFAQLAAAGGTFPYTWVRIGGTFPRGLSFSSKGLISGTPKDYGQFQFLVRVQDSAGATFDKFFVLDVILIPVRILNDRLPAAQRGVPYTVYFIAMGGRDPYTWTVKAGQVPPGLTMSSEGQLRGTPTADGEYTFTIKVVDAGGKTDEREFVLRVGASTGAPLEITTMSLPQGQMGARYSAQLAAAGGTQPYTWSQPIGRSIPAGLTLDSTGLLSGTPSSSGDFLFTVQVTDKAGASVTKDLALSIPAGGGFRITTTSPLVQARLGQAYNMRMVASGGAAPYQWVVSTGFVAAGLSLDRQTGEITGTPEETGTLEFTISAFDANFERYDKKFAMTVVEQNSSDLQLLNSSMPDGARAIPYTVALQASGGRKPYQFLILDGMLPDGLLLDRLTGVITGRPKTPGTYTFTAAVEDKTGARNGRSFTVRVFSQANPGAPDVTTVTVKPKGSRFTLQVNGGKLTDAPLIIVDELRVQKQPDSNGTKAVVKKLKLKPGIHNFWVETANGLRSSPMTFVVE